VGSLGVLILGPLVLYRCCVDLKFSLYPGTVVVPELFSPRKTSEDCHTSHSWNLRMWWHVLWLAGAWALWEIHGHGQSCSVEQWPRLFCDVAEN